MSVGADDDVVDQVGARSLADLWDEQSQLRADHPWLVFEDRDGKVGAWTYAQFDGCVRAVTAGLAGRGVGTGDAVVVHLRNCPEFVMTWFALARLGAVLVPSNIANTAHELQFVLARSHAVALVTAGEFLPVAQPAIAAAGSGTLFVAREVAPTPPGATAFDTLLGAAPSDALPRVAGDALHQILFTSGTTAAPKGVMATHANMLWAGESGAKGQGLDRNDRCLTALPLFHVNGQAVTVLSALTVGATVVLLEEFSAAGYLDAVRRHAATQTSLVAQQALALLREPARDDDGEHRLRRVGFAINIPTEAKDAFEARFGVDLINIYGLSEAMAIVSMSPLHRPQRYPSVGLPALTRTVRVIDAFGENVPAGTVGEIVVSGVPGRTVMLGYFEDPDATAAVMQDGWVRTGDAGFLDDHGYLFFFERQKDVIKCSGQNVSATEIEAVLAEHPDIVEAGVIGVPDERRGESVKAFVVLREGAQVDANAVVAHCATRLSRYKLPAQVEFLDVLPRTSVGKLAKRELRARV